MIEITVTGIPHPYFFTMSHATCFLIYDNLSPNSLTTVKFCEEEDKNGDKWREFEGKCYHTSEDSERDEIANWWEARERCIDKGADLVSIHSSRENDFIQELVLSYFVHCLLCLY